MKKFWYDEYSGGFNWALVAVFLFVGIFLFNVINANVQIPGDNGSKNVENAIEQHEEPQSIPVEEHKSPITLPDAENKLKL